MYVLCTVGFCAQLAPHSTNISCAQLGCGVAGVGVGVGLVYAAPVALGAVGKNLFLLQLL